MLRLPDWHNRRQREMAHWRVRVPPCLFRFTLKPGDVQEEFSTAMRLGFATGWSRADALLSFVGESAASDD